MQCILVCMTIEMNIPAPGPAFMEMKLYGVQPPSPGYFTRLTQRHIEEDRIELLIRMKAILTLADVMDVLEAA